MKKKSFKLCEVETAPRCSFLLLGHLPRFNRYAASTLLLVGLVSYDSAKLAHADDLLSVYNLAVTSDPHIRAAEAAKNAALEVVPQSRAMLLPSLNINADVTWDSYDTLDGDFRKLQGQDQSSYTNETYTIELRQAVFHHDRFVELKLADQRAAQAVATYAAAQQDLILRVASSYFLVLATLDNLEFVSADKEAIAGTLKNAKQRYDVGLAAVGDVHEAQARYDIAVSEELNAEKLLDNSREALQKLTGIAVQDVAVLGADIPLRLPEPADPEQWTTMALAQNPLLLAATAATNAAENQVEVQKSGHYPTLDMVARYQYRDNDFGGTGFPIRRNDSAIGLELNIPLYQGGLVSSQARQAGYQFAQAREDQREQQLDVKLRTRDRYRGVAVEISRVKALKQAILSSDKALNASQAGFEAGTRTIVDVLDSQRELLRARRDYARSRYDYLLNTLLLKQVAGIVAPSDIELINGMLK